MATSVIDGPKRVQSAFNAVLNSVLFCRRGRLPIKFAP